MQTDACNRSACHLALTQRLARQDGAQLGIGHGALDGVRASVLVGAGLDAEEQRERMAAGPVDHLDRAWTVGSGRGWDRLDGLLGGLAGPGGGGSGSGGRGGVGVSASCAPGALPATSAMSA